jgi:hypothetical protein
LQVATSSASAYWLRQIEQAHVPAAGIVENTHLELTHDFATVPGMNIPLRKSRRVRPQTFEVVRALVSVFGEKTVPSEAGEERVPSKCDAHVSMRIKVDRLEDQNAPPKSNAHGDEA